MDLSLPPRDFITAMTAITRDHGDLFPLA